MSAIFWLQTGCVLPHDHVFNRKQLHKHMLNVLACIPGGKLRTDAFSVYVHTRRPLALHCIG